MNNELSEFIRAALGKGLAKDKIKQVLIEAKWPEDEVDQALAHFADVSFPVAVPKRKAYTSAKEAFLYLLIFLTLYISAFNFGSLIFTFINKAFPDPLSYNYYSSGQMSFALASLIIAFPIYFLVSHSVNKKAKKNPEVRTSKVKKWLTYFTLFVTAGVAIGDLIAVLYRLFDGDITTRFFLKFLTVLVIAGVIFWVYLTDLRKDEKDE